MFIKTLEEITIKDISTVGGKAASLGELTQLGIPVPSGFVVTAQAFTKPPPNFEKEILKAFADLKVSRVAVRSSAIVEDGKKSSWAGQLESYLNVFRRDLIQRVKVCHVSIYSKRALAYAIDKGIPKDQMLVAVIVQRMIPSKVSGVMFTANPVDNNYKQIMIEAAFGLGESLVQGRVTPDCYVVEKDTLKIMLVPNNKEISEVTIPKKTQNKATLTNRQVLEITKLGIKIENHFQTPQDIEWAIDRENKIWILQSRPVTTLV